MGISAILAENPTASITAAGICFSVTITGILNWCSTRSHHRLIQKVELEREAREITRDRRRHLLDTAIQIGIRTWEREGENVPMNPLTLPEHILTAYDQLSRADDEDK